MSKHAPIGFCYTIHHGTGCTCCNYEDYCSGLYRTAKAAEEQADRERKGASTVRSQYAENGVHTVLKLKYELVGRFIILNDDHAREFGGFMDDHDYSTFYELPKELSNTFDTEATIAEALKEHYPDYEPPITAYATVTHGIRGFFAVIIIVNEEGLHEPFNTGFGSYATAKEAVEEAKGMAEAEGIPFIEPTRWCIIRRVALENGEPGRYAGTYGQIEHFGKDFGDVEPWLFDLHETALNVATEKTWPGYVTQVMTYEEWKKL